jgi:hypothetical protein
MATFILRDSKLWVDGFDMSGYKNKITLDAPIALKEHPRFGDTGQRRAAGLRSAALRASGYWDTALATFEPDKPYFDRIGSVDVPVSCAVQDSNEGSISYVFRAALSRYQPGAPVGEMLAFEVTAEGSDGIGVVRATILANKNVAAGAAVNGTAFNVGAIGATQKAYAALHVLQVGASLDVKIQRDTVGFPSPIDFITFAQKTAIGSEFAAPVAGPQTDDWWRIVYTSVGAPNAKFVVLFGIQ